ncbi:hypothetical protein CTEN210_04261 [Chaetoceros tenuissimus]|uniref:Uncharacterized protein n=1 Tax=Chaetoceros tenuissimus TaxID=426638 RepID=A0AAD3CKV4_9STRA|nr:hypothetical protein CTEN210_04261 [Chaetoceros tenuissimus]
MLIKLWCCKSDSTVTEQNRETFLPSRGDDTSKKGQSPSSSSRLHSRNKKHEKTDVMEPDYSNKTTTLGSSYSSAGGILLDDDRDRSNDGKKTSEKRVMISTPSSSTAAVTSSSAVVGTKVILNETSTPPPTSAARCIVSGCWQDLMEDEVRSFSSDHDDTSNHDPQSTIDASHHSMVKQISHVIRKSSMDMTVHSTSSAANLRQSNLSKASSIKIGSFYSDESAKQAQIRRKEYKHYNHIFTENLEKDDQELQDKIVDWSSRHQTLQKLRSVHHIISSHGLYKEQDLQQDILKGLKRREWLESLVALDPRRQIHLYFTEVARAGGPLQDPLTKAPVSIIRGFRRASSFSVWRPTSLDAIQLMMTGKATGKGLEVKGKSAKYGRLSGLIPFIQIHQDLHKNVGKLGLSREGRIHVYYQNDDMRCRALKLFMNVIRDMVSLPIFLPNDSSRDLNQEYRWEVSDYGIYRLNKSGFGLDISERVFYQACVMEQDITRTGDLETGRPSEPNFQSMNFESTRKYNGIGPRTVVLQLDDDEPLKPQTFVVAYEENNSVTPVASDFDCFTVGTRGVTFDQPIASEQVELMKWMIESIDKVLTTQKKNASWASHWFNVLDQPDHRKKIDMPRFGFGDPKSYEMMAGAVTRFAHNKNGAVRHGAECFNYKFPQDIDDKLLVISDSGFIDDTNRPFKYMTPSELQEFMLNQIDDGYIFPLNPKWIVADQGWKRVYDKMMSCQDESTKTSLESWYPRESGVRELIELVYSKHPEGFQDLSGEKLEGTEALDLMKQKLRRRAILRRVVIKIRTARMLASSASS